MFRFLKRHIYISGNEIAALQTSEPWTEMVPTRTGGQRPTQFAWCVSLRPSSADPNTLVLVPSIENLGFTTLRDSNVPGLDVDAETGELLTPTQIERIRAQAIMAQQRQRAEARGGAEVPFDLAPEA